MAVSLNSVIVFNSLAKHFYAPRSGIRASSLQFSNVESPSGIVRLRRLNKGKKKGLCLLVAEEDRVATDTSDKTSENAERSDADNLNGSVVSTNTKEDTSSVNVKPGLKRTPLTAREKLRAARVLSRYTETKTKASKPDLGSKVLEALRESDKGKKRSGLPEAPTNLFDDSKRGMPKAGLTFELPGGVDVFVIVFSFVFISTLMFATTFLVWKVGAIHFNEY